MRFGRNPIQIGEGELRSLTRDLDEMHHATLPAMRAELEEVLDASRAALAGVAGAPTDRRRFLFGAGVAAGGVLLAACGSSSKDKTSSAPATTVGGAAQTTVPITGDLQFMAMSASLENLAVGTYMAGIQAATASKLGPVPPAVVTFAQTAMKQHQDHADAFNAFLTAANRPRVTDPDMAVKPTVDAAFAQVKDVPGLAKLARLLENTAAATYQDGMGTLADRRAVMTLASIQPVERQHAAILSYVLGEYPVPDTFSLTNKKGEEARPASDFKS